MDIKEYIKNKNIKKANIDNIAEYIKKFDGKTIDAIMDDLLVLVSKEKKAGTFDISKINTLCAKIAPILSSIQKEKLKEIVDKIK